MGKQARTYRKFLALIGIICVIVGTAAVSIYIEKKAVYVEKTIACKDFRHSSIVISKKTDTGVLCNYLSKRDRHRLHTYLKKIKCVETNRTCQDWTYQIGIQTYVIFGEGDYIQVCMDKNIIQIGDKNYYIIGNKFNSVFETFEFEENCETKEFMIMLMNMPCNVRRKELGHYTMENMLKNFYLYYSDI